jgi:hypothetical protein
MRRKVNNWYIIIKNGEHVYEFIQDFYYNLMVSGQSSIDELIEDNVPYEKYTTNSGVELYIIMEPMGISCDNDTNNKCRLLKHLPKHTTLVNKTDMGKIEYIIRNIKS